MINKRYFVLCVLVVALLIAGGGGLLAFELEADIALLVCGETGQVLYEKNAHKVAEPASITKIMSMLLLHEAVLREELSYDDVVTISRYAQSMYGSQIFLTAGERVPVGDLQKAVAISSANDATVALAEYMAGSESVFVALMNQRAQELGMHNTHFVNSTGLPPAPDAGEHVTTAFDIALMSLELVKYPELLEKTSIWVDYLDIGGREVMLSNFNRLVRTYPGVDGIKTGHTTAAGYCLSATAEREGNRFIAVVMGSETDTERNEQVTRLLDYAFRAFQRETVVREGEKISEIELITARTPQVDLVAAASLTPYVQRGLLREIRRGKEIFDVDAPLEQGQVVGRITVYQGEELLGEVDITVGEDVPRASFIVVLWRRLVNFILNLLSP